MSNQETSQCMVWPVLKVSLWEKKGENLIPPQSDISLSPLQRVGFRSPSNGSLVTAFFRLCLCFCHLFPFSHPFTLSSILLFSRCPFIQTLVKCFPVWSFSLLFLSTSPPDLFYHITVWYALGFDSFFLLLQSYLVSGWVLPGFPGDELLSWMWIRPEALVLLRHKEKQTIQC